jgi:hypothetical protein
MWLRGIPGTQSPEVSAFQVAATGIFFMLAGCVPLAVNARWLFHTLIGR